MFFTHILASMFRTKTSQILKKVFSSDVTICIMLFLLPVDDTVDGIVRCGLMELWATLDPHYGLLRASILGELDVAVLMLQMGSQQINISFENASSHGHLDIVKLLVSKGANSFSNALCTASYANHTNIVRYIIEVGEKNYNKGLNISAYNNGLIAASENGNEDIAILMIECGSRLFDSALEVAVSNGHINIVKLLLPLTKPNYDRLFSFATRGNHIDIKQMLILHCKIPYI